MRNNIFMASNVSKNKQRGTIKYPKATVDKNMKDYNKDPFFVKKLADAEAFLAKYGLPKHLPGISK